MRTTIRLTVTRPDGFMFDRAIDVHPSECNAHAAREDNRQMFIHAFECLSNEYDAWLIKEFQEYRPSPIEEIDLAIRHAKNERRKK